MEEKKYIKISEISKRYPYTFRGYILPSPKTMIAYPKEIYISQTPFGNCQTFTIGSFYHLLDGLKDKEIFLESLDLICKKMGKRQFIIDINSNYTNEFKTQIENSQYNIVKEVPYISTNSSEMVLFIIQRSKF